MRSPRRERTVIPLPKSDATSSPQQTDIAHSTNELPEATSQPQPPFVSDDDIDCTNDDAYLSSANESHTCKGSSDSSSSFSSPSSRPSNMTKDSSVLLQGLHDSHHHYHNQDTTQQLFQNLSLSENKNPGTSTPMTRRRKLPLSRLPTFLSKSGSRHEKIKKSVSRQKRTRSKFRYYCRPGAMAAITSAVEAVNPRGDDRMGTAPGKSFDDSLVIRLKYKNSSATLATEEHAIDSSTLQHQGIRTQDIMRITSVLNDDPAPLVSSQLPSFSASSIATSNDDTSPSPSQALPFDLSARHIEHKSVHMLDHDHDDNNNSRYRFAKTGLRDKYIRQLTNPERRRYEDALVGIVGDLELPFFGGRYGSGNG